MNRLVTSRNRQIVIASTLLIYGLTLGDEGTAEAQGPLRRLGDRIRSRVEPLIQPPPAPANAPSRSSAGLRPVAPYTAPTKPVTPMADDPRIQLTPQTRLRPTSPTRQSSLSAQPTLSPGDSIGSPSIGIEVEEFNQGFRGARVVGFRSNSKADSAGLSVGDIIVGVQGRATSSIAEMADALSPMKPGESVQLRVVRSESLAQSNVAGGRQQIPTHFLDVPLVDRVPLLSPMAERGGTDLKQHAGYQQPTSDASLGMELTNAAGRQGAVVASIASRSPGEVARMQTGDRIVSMNGRMVQSAEGVSQILSRSKPGDQLRMQWVRGDQLREANVLLAGRDGIAPNAVAGVQPSAATSTFKSVESSASPASGSLLNGIGSAVGNWFANGSKQAAKPETQSIPQKATSPAPPAELPEPSSRASDALTDLSGPSILMKAGDKSDEPLGAVFDVTRELPDSESVVDSEELPMPSAVRDPLDFGDDELVQPAGFGDPAGKNGADVLPIPSALDAEAASPTPSSLPKPNASSVQSRKPTLTPFDGVTDPPSLDNVGPPSTKPPVSTSKDDQAILLLRAEIERLRSRIQELEKPTTP